MSWQKCPLIDYYQNKNSLYFTLLVEKDFKAKKVYDIYLRQTYATNNCRMKYLLIAFHQYTRFGVVTRVLSIGEDEESVRKTVESEEMHTCLGGFNKKIQINSQLLSLVKIYCVNSLIVKQIYHCTYHVTVCSLKKLQSQDNYTEMFTCHIWCCNFPLLLDLSLSKGMEGRKYGSSCLSFFRSWKKDGKHDLKCTEPCP